MKKSYLIIGMAAALMLSACGAKTAETTAAETTKAEAAAESEEAADAEAEPAEEATVTLAAAASLEYAFTEKIIPAFTAANPGITIEGTYDSSGKLQSQIESGLEADIFFSAAQKQMNALNDEGMVQSDSVKDLLENKIVLIVPAASEENAVNFEDIANFGTIAIGDPESVPVGQYSQEALTNLGLWDSIQDKVSLGTNVTEVLNWVAEGSADCGIVYATDAATTDKVKVVAEAPEGSLEKPVLYPVAMMTATESKDDAVKTAAQKFFDYICSADSAAVFEEYGFTVNQ